MSYNLTVTIPEPTLVTEGLKDLFLSNLRCILNHEFAASVLVTDDDSGEEIEGDTIVFGEGKEVAFQLRDRPEKAIVSYDLYPDRYIDDLDRPTLLVDRTRYPSYLDYAMVGALSVSLAQFVDSTVESEGGWGVTGRLNHDEFLEKIKLTRGGFSTLEDACLAFIISRDTAARISRST